jgi:hypothetical protein
MLAEARRNWVDGAAWASPPCVRAPVGAYPSSPKIFADEATALVIEPGRSRTQDRSALDLCRADGRESEHAANAACVDAPIAMASGEGSSCGLHGVLQAAATRSLAGAAFSSPSAWRIKSAYNLLPPARRRSAAGHYKLCGAFRLRRSVLALRPTQPCTVRPEQPADSQSLAGIVPGKRSRCSAGKPNWQRSSVTRSRAGEACVLYRRRRIEIDPNTIERLIKSIALNR